MLSEDDRALLIEVGNRERFDRGQQLLGQGDASEHVMLIEHGSVKVSRVAPNGMVSLLAIRAQGDLIGEFACLDHAPRSATVTALTPVLVSKVYPGRFRSLVADNPEFAATVLRMLVSRVREADQRRLEFGAYRAGGRIARIVFDMTCQHGMSVDGRRSTFALTLSRREIACAAGTSRESVSRALGDLEQRGLIEREQRHIVITDIGALGEFVTDQSLFSRPV